MNFLAETTRAHFTMASHPGKETTLGGVGRRDVIMAKLSLITECKRS
jgi:hypothetical protein